LLHTSKPAKANTATNGSAGSDAPVFGDVVLVFTGDVVVFPVLYMVRVTVLLPVFELFPDELLLFDVLLFDALPVFELLEDEPELILLTELTPAS
jgi:hypothetical protein